MKLNFLLLLFPVLVWTQNLDLNQLDSLQKSGKDIKVGLVLSGGGAKGLAHVGVLKIIEEAGIRIDYIGGTSMGAIVGGLYASGYTPHQLDSIFKTTNFGTLIQDDLPRGSKSFNVRKDSERYALKLPFDDFQIKFPSGVSKGQNIYNLYAQLLSHVKSKDFSQLPIPFLCVATNVETGEEVIIEQGNMATALSASGAIPTLFSPVYIDGMMLIDGGILNNFPVEEVRAKGMDIIIAVDVQDDLREKKNLKSGLEILTQVNNFRTIRTAEQKSKKTDVYIKPDIKEFSVLSFDQGGEIIYNGKIAAKDKIESLQKIAEVQNGTLTRHPISVPNSMTIGDIKIVGNENFPRNYITGKLKVKSFEKTSFKALNAGLNNLSATGSFEKINYTLSENGNYQDLTLRVYESEQNTQLKLGVHYDELYKTSFLANLTQKSLFFINDVASLDLIIGDNLRYNLNYYIDKGRFWSIGFSSRFNQFEDDVNFEFIQQNIGSQNALNLNQVRLENNDFTNQIFAETFLTKDFKFGLGAEYKFLEAKTETFIEDPEVNEAETIIEKDNLFSTFGYLRIDTLDDKFYPSSGYLFSGQLNVYFPLFDDYSEFAIAKGEIGYAQPLFNKVSGYIGSELGFRTGNEDLAALNFFLGGFGNHTINNFRHFLGYDFFTLSADSYIKGIVQLDFNFYKKNHLLLTANYANVEDDLFSNGNWLTTPNFSGYGVGLGSQTIIGPIDLKYSYSPETNESIWFVSLGYWF
ncbi:patatin-like phospholipase family protein [Psychroflexus sp. CAK57W]|uniref:patatin-like phospholipase family protein n=1 Tax=Psychroflexus curvus TaxID=2873595 RepID=UPI001CCEF602|nr:patatin-like phospholipase family protein [Psychroflexus curvus]MBZ9787108.1 patatin-like phospholipase family protein [Psychroflexus curvus]